MQAPSDGFISFYIIQMLGLTATSEICEIAVCGFMFFTTDMEKKAHINSYVIPENSRRLRSHVPIWDLLSSFLTLALSFFHHILV